MPLSTLAAPVGETKPLDIEARTLMPRQGRPGADIFIDSNCGSQYKEIERSVLEARELAEPLYQEYIKEGKHQLTATRYFGIQQSDDLPLGGEW